MKLHHSEGPVHIWAPVTALRCQSHFHTDGFSCSSRLLSPGGSKHMLSVKYIIKHGQVGWNKMNSCIKRHVWWMGAFTQKMCSQKKNPLFYKKNHMNYIKQCFYFLFYFLLHSNPFNFYFCLAGHKYPYICVLYCR